MVGADSVPMHGVDGRALYPTLVSPATAHRGGRSCETRPPLCVCPNRPHRGRWMRRLRVTLVAAKSVSRLVLRMHTKEAAADPPQRGEHAEKNEKVAASSCKNPARWLAGSSSAGAATA